MGVHIGAELSEDPKQMEAIFGTDLHAAGILPLQLIIENKGTQTIEIVAGQTCLIDDDNRYWRPLSNQAAADRLERAEHVAAAAPGKTARPAKMSEIIMEMAATLISRQSVQAPLIKQELPAGAITQESGKQPAVEKTEKGREKGVDGRILTAGSLLRGYLYFPADINLARELRVQVKSRDDGRLQTFNLKLK